MTISERIDWHKNEMLSPGSQTTYWEDEYGNDSYRSIFDVHNFLIDLIQDKNIDRKLYNKVMCQFFKDYPEDILFNIKPLTWNDIMPFGKHKGKLLKNIPEDYLEYLYHKLDYINFDREVLIYILFRKKLKFPVKFVKKSSSNNSSDWESDGYGNVNMMELDAWGGMDLH